MCAAREFFAGSASVIYYVPVLQDCMMIVLLCAFLFITLQLQSPALTGLRATPFVE